MACELNQVSTDELLRRASDPHAHIGFADVVAELVMRYKSVVYGQALSVSRGNRSFADDVFQETFLRLFEWLSKREGSPPLHSFARLVQVFAKRTAIDLVRKNSQDGPLVERALDPDWDNRLYVIQLMELVDERSREVLRLTYFDGYSAPEIGKLLKIKTGHVRILRFRALEMIREIQNRDRFADTVEEL